MDSFLRRWLSPVVTFREGEATTGLLMFVYSFLAMTAYNNIKPSAASKFIDDFGADNTPWVYLLAGLTMGFIMSYYSRGVGRVPKLWVLPGTQVLVVSLLVAFWFLFQTGQAWVSAAFFFFGRLLLGIFLISQFWTLANDIYDARQAKRVFGFIGGGASLGGITGSGMTRLLVERVGTETLILFSAGVLVVCFFIIVEIQRRTKLEGKGRFEVETESLGGGEALAMLKSSRHLQLIALVIGFSALGAATLDVQLLMAAEAEVTGKDQITSFLAEITLYISLIGFFIQVYLTSRVYSLLGIGFALAVLPVSLGATALIILMNKALWASSVARVSDSALRYSLDKTTRETLFLPLPTELKLKAKSFVDVVADRFIGKGIGSVILLIAIKLFNLVWWQLSVLSLVYCGLWLVLTRRAKREYMAVFRRSIETMQLEPERLTREAGDAATVETLVEELGSLDEQRVLRSIELLEALDKRNLISPLLLRHDSPVVRARAVDAVKNASPHLVERWLPALERGLADEDPDIRAAVVEVLALVRGGEVKELVKPYLNSDDPRLVATAALALAQSDDPKDRDEAESLFLRLALDDREAMVAPRREAARAISRTTDPRFRRLLVGLMNDADPEVALEAIRSARQLGDSDLLFVPTLVSLLRNPRSKNAARAALVSYGEAVVPTLRYFLLDEEEDTWVRRHIPTTLARVASNASVEALVDSLSSDDGFLRYKAIVALETIAKRRPDLQMPREPIEKLLLKESTRYYRYLGARYELFEHGDLPRESLLDRALGEKLVRQLDRIFRLLGLIHDRSDIHAARIAIERGDSKARTSAVEFLDNMLAGAVRKRLLPIIDDVPNEERVRKGNVLLKTRIRGPLESLTRLVYDDDVVIAATAIDIVRERKMWSLVEDLEQVLEYRDAKDFAVFEAASHALAAYRQKEVPAHAV
ncbi:MAG TPA: Npt1/Npt2 family nucleotide transporter [Vicinamibacteria bacterium]|nr:Npt1/Npt2 family nucleotide transporter [Vicinamibacteria bacterium]